MGKRETPVAVEPLNQQNTQGEDIKQNTQTQSPTKNEDETVVFESGTTESLCEAVFHA